MEPHSAAQTSQSAAPNPGLSRNGSGAPLGGGGAHAGERPGLERLLSNPGPLFILALLAAAIATVGTAMGELELLRASDMNSAEAERNVWIQQGAIWLGWALSAPVLMAIATRLARDSPHWVVAALCHLPLAGGVASAFLAAEIVLQEQVQGPEDTELFATVLKMREEWRANGGVDRRWGRGTGDRPPGDRRRGGRRGRGDDNGEPEGSALRPEGAPPPSDTGGSDNQTGADSDLSEQGTRDPDREPPPRPDLTPQQFRRLRSMRGRPVANVATGDFAKDFERRWRLRVPRYAMVYLALVAIGLGIRAFLVGRARDREASELEVRASHLESELTEARLAALKGQLHPHFLFNALHSVGGLIRSERGPEALTALSSIGDLLRTTLDAGGEQFVPLSREMELIERYLGVEGLRLGDRLTVEIVIPEELAECEVPAFITQPLVENAIKHGVATLQEGGRISITARAEGVETLVIDIENDGPAPVDPGPGSNRTEGGVGIRHVRTRLATLFDDAASLELCPGEPSGALARLRMPLEDLEA